MQPELIARTTLIGVAIVLCALGAWHNDSIAAWERRAYDVVCDRIAFVLAKLILAYRRRRTEKALIRIEKAYETIEKSEKFLKKIHK